MPESRAFRVLLFSSIGVFVADAALSAGWQVLAGAAPEPGWLVRVWAAGWFAALALTLAAVLVLLAGKRRSRA